MSRAEIQKANRDSTLTSRNDKSNITIMSHAEVQKRTGTRRSEVGMISQNVAPEREVKHHAEPAEPAFCVYLESKSQNTPCRTRICVYLESKSQNKCEFRDLR